MKGNNFSCKLHRGDWKLLKIWPLCCDSDSAYPPTNHPLLSCLKIFENCLTSNYDIFALWFCLRNLWKSLGDKLQGREGLGLIGAQAADTEGAISFLLKPRQACSPHHQIVIWICFWFVKLNQYMQTLRGRYLFYWSPPTLYQPERQESERILFFFKMFYRAKICYVEIR